MSCTPYEGSHSMGHFSTFEGAYNHALNLVAQEGDNGPDEDPDLWVQSRTERDILVWKAAENPYDSIQIWPIEIRQDVPEVSA